jgi:hypothetical protein
MEVLPEMQEVLSYIEKLLSFGVPLILKSEKMGKLAAKVVWVVLVLGAAAPKYHVFLYAEVLHILDQRLTVCGEVIGLMFDESFQLRRIDA